MPPVTQTDWLRVLHFFMARHPEAFEEKVEIQRAREETKSAKKEAP